MIRVSHLSDILTTPIIKLLLRPVSVTPGMNILGPKTFQNHDSTKHVLVTFTVSQSSFRIKYLTINLSSWFPGLATAVTEASLGLATKEVTVTVFQVTIKMPCL